MSNNIKRVLSSIILLPLSILVIIEGKNIFNIVLLFCSIITILEWLRIAFNKYLKFFGLIFILFSFFSIYQIRNINDTDNILNFLIIFLTCVATDIGGFIFGKILKGPKLTKISPKKTYSGMIGSFIFSVSLIYLILHFINNSKYLFDFRILIFVIIVSSISQLGDLMISYFKRKSNLKDTGNIIPGHGGILDRIDGMIFVFPILYLFKYLI